MDIESRLNDPAELAKLKNQVRGRAVELMHVPTVY